LEATHRKFLISNNLAAIYDKIGLSIKKIDDYMEAGHGGTCLCYLPIISLLGRQKWEEHKFQANLEKQDPVSKNPQEI
jgi:hypothetical protein